ncbi:sulfite exporter TauE/SafE family protein [Metabacillus sp. GX 13764]|uniref:sulfite exporter TauE/SafE family protein n=1 Tax=Metabacillus kandeliae TaxID=2900151 RepID=UPI001E54B694|nr:sulfite exporter TauE/SafE family protein [Metabacillus kandeliae]MCD7035475.1 sulfite exporter TauE/SafE family protein [Metabacillus kandeliae]
MIWPLFLIGIFTSLLGTLAGGGGLIGMPAMMLYGLPVHTIIAANKFSNTISSFSSFFVLLRDKTIRLKDALAIIPFACAGGITGALLASLISEKTMTGIALVLLVFALILQFVKKPVAMADQTGKIPAKIYPLLYGISVYDGLFGPGQASLNMQVYLHQGFSYLKAIAFTRFQTFLSCFGALLMFQGHGLVDWQAALSLAAGSLIGAQLSVRIAKKIRSNQAIWIVRLITIFIIAQLLYSFFT